MSVYPSDAPLPRFNITRVQGKRMDNGVRLFFAGALTNYQQVKEWFASQGIACTWMQFSWYGSNYVISVGDKGTYNDFDGAIDNSAGWAGYLEKTHFGKYVTPEPFDRVQVTSDSVWLFSPPISLGCSVYVPSPDELSPEVWTDLQFTVSPPIPEVPWIVIVPLAIFGIGALAYWYLKKRK